VRPMTVVMPRVLGEDLPKVSFRLSCRSRERLIRVMPGVSV